MLDCPNLLNLPQNCLNLVDLLGYRALNQPKQVAYRFLADGETETNWITYEELDRQSRAIAVQLQALNLSGERALLLYPSGLDYLAAFFGCLYAGVVAVPAYPPRNDRNIPRIKAIVADSGAAIALTNEASLAKTQALLKDVRLRWLTTDNLVELAASWQEPIQDLAFLQYTSGSTGTPKGVMLSHRNLLHNAATTYQCMEHSPESTFVSWLPTYHDMGLIGGILQPLYGGFPCILMPPTAFLQRPYRWLQAISKYRGTTSGGPNFAYEQCIQKITPEQKETLDLSSWSVAFNGAEPIRADTLEKFADTFASCGFRREAFYPCYGLAEASLMVSGSRKSEPPVVISVQKQVLSQNQVAIANNGDVRTLVSCGQSIPDQQIVIAHPDTLTRCLPDEVGEIWVSSPSVGQGYWNRREETASTFEAYLSDTGVSEAGRSPGPFLRTGDLGFLHQGGLFVTSRAKDLIIIRGRNLYPQDIELTVEQSHPSLRSGSGAAFAIEVDNEEQLVVVQEVEFRAKPDIEEVTSTIRQAVAQAYEVQVYGVVLIKAGSIPKTSSGKIQRRACREQFLANKLDVLGSSILSGVDVEGAEERGSRGAEEQGSRGAGEKDSKQWISRELLLGVELEERRSLLESYLQALVGQVLNVNAEVVQSISSLGLDSLKVFELKNQIESDLGVVVPIAEFFADTSIAQLASNILAQVTDVVAIEPIKPISGDRIELSFAQERLWFLEQLEPGNYFYNLAAAVHLTGNLDVAALTQSLNAIIQRHEVLRTRFVAESGKPRQIVELKQKLNLAIADISHYSELKQEAEVKRLSLEIVRSPFDLQAGCLLRAQLLQLAETNHILLLSVHHIVFDGLSINIFLQELATFYEAFTTGKTPSLNNLPIQYADFASWQRQWLQTEVVETQKSYWKQQLEGDLPKLNLPTDFPCSTIQSFQGARQTFELPQPLVEALTKLSQQENTTLFITLLAAFKTLLYRYTANEDILVGSPIANRNRTEIENLIGFFVNTLVLRTDLSNNPSFRQLLQRVSKVAIDAYAHQDLPFEQLVKELKTRNLSETPLVQVMVDFQQAPPCIELPELSMKLTDIEAGTGKFDLTLSFLDTEQGLVGSLEYNANLFKDTTIARMLGHFQTLLTDIVAHPDHSISDLSLLTKLEQQLLGEWNCSDADYSQDKCLHQLFEEQVEKTPLAIAVVFENQHLTYIELNTRANKIAHYLRQLGVGAEVLVGICIERSPLMIIGILGILKAGGAYIPLAPTYPQERLAFMLENSKASVLLTQQHLKELLPQHQAQVIELDKLEVNEYCSQENLEINVTPCNLAYVIYTSGSTGKPKGVLIEHRSICNRLLWGQNFFNLTASDRVLQKASLSFDVSIAEIFGALLAGSQLILADTGIEKDADALVKFIAEKQITVADFVPSMLQVFLESAEVKNCNSLRCVTCGGEALSVELQNRFFELLNAQLYNLYGPTEAAIDATFWTCRRDELGIVPIGRAIANTQIYILDRELKQVPVGVAGELHIGGVNLARDYLNQPQLTAQKFVAHPFQPGERLYKTGDLARYQPDGTIEYLGRLDEQVKIRGFRVELGEIEAVLRQHPVIKDSVVIESNQRLVAYIVSDPIANLKTSALRSFLREKLPEYMIPAGFVLLEALPLTLNGKVDRRSLPIFKPSTDTAFVAPRTPVEKLLTDIWVEVLGVEVGIHDNFFQLGGHSLLATQLMAKVRQAFRVDLPLSYLFQFPTVASLSEVIANMQTRARQDIDIPITSDFQLPEIVPAPDERYQLFPLNDIQQAYWLGRSQAFELGNVATHGYLEVECVNLDLQRFNSAWQQLIERHQMLRAIVRDGQQQILAQVPSYEIQVLDLRGQNCERVNAQLEAVRESLSHQMLPCDLFPLFEIRASLLDNQQVRLHFSMDGLIADAWSYQIIGRELAQLYQNLDTALPEIELSFRDYVLGELGLKNSKLYQRSLEYWQKRIPTLPSAPELPLTQNPATLKQPTFGRRSGRLEPQTWLQLKTHATQAGVTAAEVLLAAFAEVLTIWSKNPQFTICLTLFNRLPLHPQVNDIVGDFTSLTLLAVDNSIQEPFAVRVKRLQAQLWEDIDHRYFSGVQVLRELNRIQGRVSGGLMPVVFTSTLNQDTADDQAFPLHWLGEKIYEITQTSQVLLDVQVAEEAGALVFNWDAVEDLFPIGILDDMFTAYADLLQHLACEAQSWQATIPQLIPATQVSQLAAINATAAPVPNELLHTLFTAQVWQRPEQIAVSGDRTLTYQELSQRANQLGEQLQKLGACPNQLVAVVMEKGWEQVVGVLGILISGAAYVPIDPGLPQERRSQLLSQANVNLVVTQSWLDSNLEWSADIQRICVDTLDGNSDRILEPIQQPEDLAYVIYTSGSTGQPKGVMIDHQGAVNTILDINQRFGINASDRVLALSSLSFDLSVYDIFGTLAVGATIIIPDPQAKDPAHWAELIVSESITIWNSAPALMQMMVEYAISRPSILASLRLILLSGDWLPITLPTQLQNLVKGIQVISLGGATEASIWSILYPISQVDPTWKSIPYGKPMQNQRFYVLNQALEVCPVWVTGQLYIGGVGLAKGYWQDEVKTAASFITHPRTGERLYRTGDLGRHLPDGTIEFLGREDFQVKIGGYRIELGEIEAALEQHSAVKEAVVIALGQYKRLIAYVVLNVRVENESDSVISSKLRCFLSDKLPHYMVPARFVMLDSLPLTPNGKVNRQALAELEHDQELVIDVAPRTDIEKALVQMWSKILGLPQIGINSNFFQLGGDSLLATQVISQVREKWQVELPLRSLFEYPAIAQFSQQIEQAKPQNLEFAGNVIAAVSRDLYRKSNNSQGLKSLADSESPLNRTRKIEN